MLLRKRCTRRPLRASPLAATSLLRGGRWRRPRPTAAAQRQDARSARGACQTATQTVVRCRMRMVGRRGGVPSRRRSPRLTRPAATRRNMSRRLVRRVAAHWAASAAEGATAVATVVGVATAAAVVARPPPAVDAAAARCLPLLRRATARASLPAAPLWSRMRRRHLTTMTWPAARKRASSRRLTWMPVLSPHALGALG
jgi:hypothetical protein